MVGIAMGLIAQHLGMSRWEVVAVTILVGVGLPLAIGGRWKNW